MTSPEYTEHGRWGGKLTSKPLPEIDDSIEALHPRERSVLASCWLTRAAMERRVADSFEVIHASMARLQVADPLLQIAERAIDDEYRHAELSRLVASRFAGKPLPAPARLPLEVPKHKGATPAQRDTLFILGQCALNETTASVFLEVCLTHAEGPYAKAAIRELMSDEIDHARVGWAHLASLGEEARAATIPWLLPMTYLNLRRWKEETPALPEQTDRMALHGMPPASALHEGLVEAIRTLIVPGFRQLALPTTPIEAWLEAGAFTDRPPTEFADL